jgi:hypothetical protein
VNKNGLLHANVLFKATNKLNFSSYSESARFRKCVQTLQTHLKVMKSALVFRETGPIGTGTWVHSRLMEDMVRYIEERLPADAVIGGSASSPAPAAPVATVASNAIAPSTEHSNSELRNMEFTLNLPDGSSILIPVRSDGMINATALCKAGGKLYAHWKENESTKQLITAFETSLRIPIKDLIISIQGGNPKLQGTWVHRKVAYHLAQWISPCFAVQVSNWLDELRETVIAQQVQIRASQEALERLTIGRNPRHKPTLTLNTIEVVSRDIDGYIDLNLLCQAGNADFREWKKLKRSLAFLDALTIEHSSGRNQPLELLKVCQGGNGQRHTWGHPQIAVNIAQWISPEFDVKVSKWVFELRETVIAQQVQLRASQEALERLESVERLKSSSELRNMEFTLGLPDGSSILIPVRSDGMINATALCKAGGKLYADFSRLNHTAALLRALSTDMRIPITDLITSIQGGDPKLQGTWVHRKVAYHLAQWISPCFAVQVSNWLDELFVTGRVESGKEKSNEEIEAQYRKQIESLTLQVRQLQADAPKRERPVIDIEAYKDVDVVYVLEFKPITEGLPPDFELKPGYSLYKGGSSSFFEKRSRDHDSNRHFGENRIDQVFCYRNARDKASAESRLKEIVKMMGLKVSYFSYQECFAATGAQIEEIYAKMNEYGAKLVNSSGSAAAAVVEESSVYRDIEFKKIDANLDLKTTMMQLEKTTELDKKLGTFTTLFKNGKLTFEQYERLLKLI